MKSASETKILICGYPRSGTTWIGRSLSIASGGKYIHEPDNDKTNWSGFIHKGKLHRFPYSDNESLLTSLYENIVDGRHIPYRNPLSRFAFQLLGLSFRKREELIAERCLGQTPKGSRQLTHLMYKLLSSLMKLLNQRQSRDLLLIKSVHSGLALPSIIKSTELSPLIIFRNPAAILASQVRNVMPDLNRNVFNQKSLRDSHPIFFSRYDQLETQLERAAAQLGLHHQLWMEWIDEYKWPYAMHEDLITSPLDSFRKITDQLNIPFNQRVLEKYITENAREGEGYDTQRTQEQLDKWKHELNVEDLEQIRRGYSIFPDVPYAI